MIVAQLPNAPSGWEGWDTRTVVVFIAVTCVGAMVALIWYLLREQKEARTSFLTALNAVQLQFHQTEMNGNERHRLLVSALVQIKRRDKEHAATLTAVHELLKSLAVNIPKLAKQNEH